MNRNLALLLLASLGACATYTVEPSSGWVAPTYSGSLPTQPEEEEGAPKDTSLPVGLGITTGPSSFLLGATLDFPIDKKITFGPSLQYGFDDDITIMSVTGQLKYFLSPTGDKDSFSILPYVTAGVGVASIDKEGRSSDSGVIFDIGGGLRYLTGDHYRLGSEVRLNILPDDLGGEGTYLSWELLQIVISF